MESPDESPEAKPASENNNAVDAAEHHTVKPRHHAVKVHHPVRHVVPERKPVSEKSSDMSGFWIVLSVVLGLLFIASVFTQGFRMGNKVDNAIKDLNDIKSRSGSDTTKSAITDAISSLEAVKSELLKEAPKTPGTPTGSSGKVKLDFYVMSQCPYGTQVEDAVKPVLDKFGDSIDFSLNFIATDKGDGTFQSLHGDNEVKGDTVQLCAAKYSPKQYMSMVVCMNKAASAIPGNWEQCAKDSGVDVAKVKACYEGAEGKTLLSASIKKSEAVKASGSPTMYLNGKPYSSGRDSLSFTKAVCSGLTGHPECASMPACGTDDDCIAQADKVGVCENAGTKDAKCTYKDASPVNLVVVSDKRCGADCDVTQLTSQLKTLFKGLKVTSYDYSDTQGKEIYDKNGLKFLPALLFDNTVKNGEGYANVQNYLEAAGSYTSLRIGASFDPKAEICNNNADDNGDGKVDCQDATCKDTAQCLEFKKPTIDFFVMSYCPYGNQAEEAIAPAYNVLGNDADFRPHYIYYANYQGGGASYCIDSESKYCSMHGVQEAHQDIREMCVKEQYGVGAWFNFSLAMNKQCTAQNADTCWENVAKGLGYDTAKIKSCQDTKYSQIAAEDARLMTVFGASGSPSVYINGKEYTGSRSAAGFQSALCALFTGTKPAGCSATLAGPADAAAAPTTGGCG